MITKLAGAEIYTKVGNAGKADFLSKRFGIPRDRIFNSRDADRIAQIMAATSGGGIDVVLNSLVGDMLHESWRCCAEFGTFVEIGKRDILDAGKLDMNVFLKDVMFTAFDLTNLYYSTALGAREL
jgi:NADPH:quinone reductase-like Zn-dependent oxidoreductase